MKRRTFVQSSAIASTAWLVPGFLKASPLEASSQSRTGKILVVIQLSGGNDGLNTIVPFRNDIYFNSRPSLALKDSELLKISENLAFNAALSGLRTLYDEGLVSIINSVGYPNPDRSHFRSMDIWHTASSSNAYWQTGWIGRYLDHHCEGCAPAYHAVEVDDTLSLAMKGKQQSGFAMSTPQQLRKTTKNPFLAKIANDYQAQQDHELLHYLHKTLIDTQESADYLVQQANAYRSNVQYPSTAFGKDLKQIAQLITTDTDTKVYYVSLTGFDTHANQKNAQGRLLKTYADGVKAFVEDLQKHQLLDDTLIMTFSEFGRRVKQNASRGTDHGAANNLFLIGGKLQRPGFYNEAPDLKNLFQGDIVHQVDFRHIYATILEHWLDTSSMTVLQDTFEPLPLL